MPNRYVMIGHFRNSEKHGPVVHFWNNGVSTHTCAWDNYVGKETKDYMDGTSLVVDHD